MKAIITLTFSLLTFWANAQAPVNDDCAGIIDLGEVPYCSDPAQYTNVDATASNISVLDNIPACFNNGVERDVWFQFTLPADGSIVDIVINVYGDINGNGTMQMPQVAIYRGDCLFEGLAELDCAAAPLNVNTVQLEQFGLTPGIPYFLRINDYSATAAPNAGTFKLCIEKYIPDINIGEVASTGSCTGTLWDSGGPTGDYSSGEDLSFTICPQDFHQCIVLNVENYSLEQGFDYIGFYEGDDLTGLLLTQITGFGSNFEVQIPGDCATIRFLSDFIGEDAGFQITWTCSPDACTAPPATTCADPAAIPALPFVENGLSNCFSGNTIVDGPCDDDLFLEGNDYIFSYTSPGDECIKITTTGTNPGAGIGVYDQCPNLAGANCIGSAGGGFFSVDPTLGAAFLENPGTYYIVFGAGADCSPFNISIDTVVCPVVLPPASTCDAALNIGGCSTILPEIIALTPGAGDPGFLVDGVNQGCFVAPQENFSFFYFVAGADGKFGFTVQAADPNEASDIDYNVWGPINSVDEICDYVTNNQPVRSSWSAGADPTGLADTNPVLGTPVLDNFDCGSTNTPSATGDDFTKLLDVVEGKIYVVMLDDYGNAIINGGISIDFMSTTPGVLEGPENNITVSADTAVCEGQPVQLLATGGEAYFWGPPTTLSCSNCANPIANPTATTTYQVQIATTCSTVNRTVDVKIIDLDLGPNPTVCNGASFTLNPNPYPNATYNWIGNSGLSCTDCPSPTVAGLTTGIYTYIAILTTPQCVKTDTIKVTVVNGQQPQYIISDDLVICNGESVTLGGAGFPGSFYSWTSAPSGLTSTGTNPLVSPTETTTYYLSVTNGSCPVASLDSVLVSVYQSPVLAVQGDTAICNGQSVLLGTTTAEPGITYAWTPDDGSLDSASLANPLATPLLTTIYHLTASNPGCEENRTVTVAVVNLDLQLSVEDSVLLCKGTSLPIQTTITPPGTVVNWSPVSGLQIGPLGESVVATPYETTLYTATASLPGCLRTQTVYVAVDSLPSNLAISPPDTTVCQGSQVLLTSLIYEPAEYPNIQFQWTPTTDMLTPDSLYNAVVTPSDTITYHRITINGGCIDTASVLIDVIIPPMMLITPPVSGICQGESVSLTLSNSAGVEDIAWTPENTLSCSDCNTPVATPGSTTTYTASGSYKGCNTSASATVNVNNPPQYAFPNDVQLCAGESIVLNTINDPGAIYTWTSTDPTFGTVHTAQPTATPTQTTTYFLETTNGCLTKDTVTVVVNSATLQANGDTTICKGNETLLTAATSVPGNSLIWSTGQNGNSINVSPDETTVYTVTFNFGDNCQITDQVTVNVQGQTAEVQPPTDTQLCPGESITLNNVTTPGATYSWSSNPPGFSSSEAQPSLIPAAGVTTYTVSATLGNCVIVKNVVVTAYTATLDITGDTDICQGESTTITANASATGDYQWSNGQTTSMFTVDTLTKNTTYSLVYTYGDGCVLEDDISIVVHNNFMLHIVADPTDTVDIYVGDPIDLTAIVAPTQNLSGFQFNWLENNVNQVGTTDMITVMPTHNDTTAVPFTYLVTATSQFGCVQTETYTVDVLPPVVQFPNVFTPNGDGVNDNFSMIILGGRATVERMEVYNRWGQKVFESSEANAKWDGKIGNNDATSDVYYYIIRWRRGDGSLQVKKDQITLLR